MEMEWITNLNTALVLLFCALSAYQYIYIFVSIFFSARRYPDAPAHRYAVLICARNESAVISQLIDSIKRQEYPVGMLKTFVLADNCTDDTAAVAAAAGAIVYERQDKKFVGKGYALDTLFRHIGRDFGVDYFDGYFVLDADNLISPDYVKQMNSVFSAGYRVVTSYRNTKNYGDNWISSSYGLMFMREARHMNNARMILHTSSVISGTGFLISHEIIEELGGGWPYHCLTEDLEFSMNAVAGGECMGYCHDAVFYDEQPTSFMQSCRQRIRWARGFLQAIFKHGFKVMVGMFRSKSGFACFDELMSTLPTLVLSFVAALSLGSMVASLFLVPGLDGLLAFLWMLAGYIGSVYLVNFLLGLVTLITEWKQIRTTKAKKILSAFTYPIFMMLGAPLAMLACFLPPKWKEIKHTVSKSIDELTDTQADTDAPDGKV